MQKLIKGWGHTNVFHITCLLLLRNRVKRHVLFLSMTSGLLGNLAQMPWICKSLGLETSKCWILMWPKYAEWGSAKLYACSLEEPRGAATAACGCLKKLQQPNVKQSNMKLMDSDQTKPVQGACPSWSQCKNGCSFHPKNVWQEKANRLFCQLSELLRNRCCRYLAKGSPLFMMAIFLNFIIPITNPAPSNYVKVTYVVKHLPPNSTVQLFV